MSELPPLTDRQRQVYDYIRAHLLDKGRPPTLREICGHIDSTSPNGAMSHVRLLVAKGWLVARPGGSKGGSVYVPAVPELVAEFAVLGDKVRIGTTGLVEMTAREWERWLKAELVKVLDKRKRVEPISAA